MIWASFLFFQSFDNSPPCLSKLFFVSANCALKKVSFRFEMLKVSIKIETTKSVFSEKNIFSLCFVIFKDPYLFFVKLVLK